MILNQESATCQCQGSYQPEIVVEKVDTKVFFAYVPDILGSASFGTTKMKAMNKAFGFWRAAHEGLN
jgi:predicted RNase H-like HicB family nuclease